MTAPAFAVVGHPNKGKSSIVATLAQDDSVRIAAEAGTTIESRRYPMTVDGKVLYTLFDTPGFQRARRTLEWMRQHESTADKHPDVVERFVREHAGVGRGHQFHEECQLLRPIVEGAGILYVVDGSTPYGPEYEPEMEILRWTGRPSMALINPIGETDHIAEWQKALGQYFRIVRVFDVMTAEYDKRIDLLRAFGELDESWRDSLSEAINYLQRERGRRHSLSARTIAEMLADMLTLQVNRKLLDHEAPQLYKQSLEEEFRNRLRATEKHCRQAIENLYEHRHIERDEDDVELLDDDLFSETTWSVFGLNRHELITAGTVGGAIAGGAIDLAVGGASLLIGTGIGALVGGVGAWWTADRLAKVRVLNQPLGGRMLVCGPTTNMNFPFVVLNRARLHHRLVSNRAHAKRDILRIADQPIEPLSQTHRDRLAKLAGKLRKAYDNADDKARLTEDLAVLVDATLHPPK